MPTDSTPLTDAERAELEQLRAEKQAREDAERARRERAELEQLRSERARHEQVAQERARTNSPARAQEPAPSRPAPSIMEPDDDLSMPLGQKIVLAALAVIVLAIIAVFVFGPKS